MGDRGSKSVIFKNNTVKEQRVDGSYFTNIKLMELRCTLIAGKSGSKVKDSR